MRVESINGTHVTFSKDSINGQYSGKSVTMEEYKKMPKTIPNIVIKKDSLETDIIKKKDKSK